MDHRVVKLQVKLFIEGDEEHAVIMTSDIFRTEGMFSSSIAVPNVDFWIRDAARALFEGRRTLPRVSAPDPELMQSISIVDETVAHPDVVFDTEGEVRPVNEKNEDVCIEEIEQDNITSSAEKDVQVEFPDDVHGDSPDANESLNISVTAISISEEQEKKQLRVIIRKEAMDKAKAHARQDTSRETGGVMLGMSFENEQTITVVFTAIVQALRAVRETSSVNFTPETWAEIWQTIDQHPDYSDEILWGIVGWYHTHPDFGIFLSGYDKFIQKEYFTRKGHLALVIDPVRNKDGIFVTDKKTGDTPALAEEYVTTVEDDRELLELFNKVQEKRQFTKLPPSEITLIGKEITGGDSNVEPKENLPAIILQKLKHWRE